MSFSKRGVSLNCESLETREVPAKLYGGNILIKGTEGDDEVIVKNVMSHGECYIQVDCNGYVQKFKASSVTGYVKYWGYDGNDYFDYSGQKKCYVDGGEGDDYIGGDKGNDILCGGDGYDTIEGWGGNDCLKGGDEGDVLSGGYGNDCEYGGYGDDWMCGGYGNDKMYCGEGYDCAWGGGGSDGYWGVEDDDALYYVPLETPFGDAGSSGAQDCEESQGDTIWS